jgi:hypothetical protein
MAGFAQIGRLGRGPSAFAAFWADARCLVSYSARAGRGAGRAWAYSGRGVVGVADSRSPPGRAAVSGAAHPVLVRPPRYRHRGTRRPRRRTRQRHGSFRRNGRRPRGAVDLPRGRPVVELRAGLDHAQGRRRRAPRRRSRHPAARTLLEPLSALRGPSRRRVRVAADLPRRGAAVGAAADAADRCGFGARREPLRRAGAPSCSSL